MPESILNTAAIANCPHAIPVQFASSSGKVLVDAAPPLIVPDKGTITGCPFTLPNGKRQPCVDTKHAQPATKVLVEGKAVILRSAGDLCLSREQIPNGPVSYSTVQTKVSAT